MEVLGMVQQSSFRFATDKEQPWRNAILYVLFFAVCVS